MGNVQKVMKILFMQNHELLTTPFLLVPDIILISDFSCTVVFFHQAIKHHFTVM
jgi:hypothetical protein